MVFEHKYMNIRPSNYRRWLRRCKGLFLILTAQNQLWLSTCVKQAITLRGKILESLVITTNNRYGQRLCLEAWHINASPCALNRDDGSHLPQEYLHLVGR